MLLHKPKNKNKKLMWTIRDVRHYQGRARERNQTQRGMKSLLTMDLYSWSCILTSSVQSLSRVQFFEMPWMPGFPVHHQLPELAQTLVHWVGDAIQPSHPLSSPSPPASIFPTIRVFSNESVLCIRWPKYWSFSLSISPSNEHPGLISFRMDWLDLLAI